MDKRVIMAFVISMIFISAYNAYVLKPMMEKKQQAAGMSRQNTELTPVENPAQSPGSLIREKGIGLDISSLLSRDYAEGNKGDAALRINERTEYLLSPQGVIGVKQSVNGDESVFTLPVPTGLFLPTEDVSIDIKKMQGKDNSWLFGLGKGSLSVRWLSDAGVLTQSVSINKKGNGIIWIGPVLKQSAEKKNRYTKFNFGVIVGEVNGKTIKARRIPLIKEKEILKALSSPVAFAGVYDKYKISVAVFDEPRRVMFFKDKGLYGITSFVLPEEKSLSIRYYAGISRPEFMGAFPHKKAILKKGMLSGITNVLLFVLKMFYKITKNWGIAIILLAISFSVVFLPLTMKSYAAIRKMQKIQPEMKVLQEKYKDKPEELNKELVLLYHKHGVNPFSGCLPLLVQLPVFFALYPVLINTYELKHSGFLWIKDLSSPDMVFVFGRPVHLLPIILGVLMILQQKFSSASSGVDGQQKAMMWAMPIVFILIFYNMPSGLVLFWLVMSLINMGQQIYIARALT